MTREEEPKLQLVEDAPVKKGVEKEKPSILERVKREVEAGRFSLNEIAKAINYGRSTLAQYLAGQYKGGAYRIEEALEFWLYRVGAGWDPERDDHYATPYIETSATAKVIAALTRAQEGKELQPIIGAPGVGKSFAVNEWTRRARREGIRFAHVVANVTTGGAVAIVLKIAEALGIAKKGRASYQQLDAIVAYLSGTPTALLIDESQHLKVSALEAVRAIHDSTKVGVALLGSDQLERTLTFNNDPHQELRQLIDRLAPVERIGLLLPTEVASFVTQWMGMIQPKEVVARLASESGRYPRRLVRLLSVARSLRKSHLATITVDEVDAAVARLLQEQRL
jgi:DNA transposition AAA+ family ATPase